ncbi:hypothetical protein FEM48_Zijuj06G0194100 [Ziziphus jujuba var. spinosa]|uniref:EGF-like domain-containing protein n=1 Tax=Ziziphus jujuba var. spinosa TaxID=714518 RepID=A0A978VB61_ZIZJJ|nr:hypothetical protein FEM48_Zijuj06G0194100 [Ziziphus jujuba var. spinosa]
MFWAKSSLDDKFIWVGSRTGSFTVSLTYNLEENVSNSKNAWWNYLWKSRVHERSKFFMWKLANLGLPVMSNLLRRGVEVESENCVHGCDGCENEIHVFFHCEVAKMIWFTSPWCIRWDNIGGTNIFTYLKSLIDPAGVLSISPNDKESFFFFNVTILEHLWGLRNKTLHKEPIGSMDLAVLNIWNSHDGKLILKDEKGSHTPISNSSVPASSASMLDTGNFVLYDKNSTIVWQSFDVPTDTLLYKQPLFPTKELVSGESETNPASGRFRLRMQRDGNLVQYPVDTPTQPQYAYWASGTFTFGDNVTLNLDRNGQIYLVNSTGYRTNVSGTFADNLVYRLTVDVDGILRLYSHGLVQNQNWSVEWSSTSDKCVPLGSCGLNAYCISTYEGPSCQCLPGFDFVDGNRKNLGCKRNFSIDCVAEDEEHAYSITELNEMRLEDDPYSTFFAINKSVCVENCLRDCNCEAASFKNLRCSKQKLPLRFARPRKRKGPPWTTFIKIGNGSSDCVFGNTGKFRIKEVN